MSSELVRVLVNDTWYEVEIGEISSAPFEVVVNGKPCLVQVETGESDSQVQHNPVQTGQVPIAAPARAMAAAGGNPAREIRAPMPGVILEIRVEPGETIKSGQVVCFLEAMKMKNAIRSPQEGKIAAVMVVEGQKVAYNDLLIRIE